MNIDIIKLSNSNVSSIPFSFNYSFNTEQLNNSGILKLDNVMVEGYIQKDTLFNLSIKANVKAVAVVPCSITLKPTEVNIDINIDEQLDNLEEIDKNNKKTLDILPIIWENILVEIPSKVVSSEVPTKLSGEGWEFITEEKGKINPELEKLKDLL